MIRKIIDVKFKGKIYKVGEVTMGDYLLFLDDPTEAVKKILLEFNGALPKYWEPQDGDMLVKELFWFLDDVEKKKKPKTSKEKDEAKKEMEEKGSGVMTESIAFFMNIYHQPYSEIMQLTLKTFIELSEFMPKVQGGETEEEKNTPDKEGIKEAMQRVKLPIDNHL